MSQFTSEVSTMKIALLILFYPLLTAAYNLEVQNVMIYMAPSLNDQPIQSGDSLFGYSVHLSLQKQVLSNGSSVHEPWMFVGAPKANYSQQPDHRNMSIPDEPGVAYRCPLPHDCVPIKVTNPMDESGFLGQLQITTLIEKGHGWFGAAMSLYELTNSLTICAPRTIMRMYEPLENPYLETMQGFCYSGKLYSGNLHIEDKNLLTYDFDTFYWRDPINGFAVHYPIQQTDIQPNSVHPIIGSPTHEAFGTVHEIGQIETVDLPIGDELSKFGFALTSGYYFNQEQLVVAAGAPGWNYVGQVALIDRDTFYVIWTIDGKEFGENFGASLSTGDMNNDGLDDLIVGAPNWDNDNGRVYIFLGNKDGFSEADILLEGNVDDGLYGYAMTCGDLDGDGFDDLVIGAPWEDSGVIYVYNGDAKLRKSNSLEPSQRIASSMISRDISRFGFSFSKPVDIDGNGFSDIAVGAYASGHAVILRSKPAVKTAMNFSIIPQTLHRNTSSFVLRLCLEHFPNFKDGEEKWDATIDVIVDDSYKRVLPFNTKFMFLRYRSTDCIDRIIHLQKNISNYVDPIQIVGHHKFWYISQLNDCKKNITMGSLCPIEYKARNITAQTDLSFDIDCGMDDICNSFIFASLEFQGIRNSTWIIGSDDLTLVLWIENREEPAYHTTVTFNIPNEITLKSVLPWCPEEEDSEILRVTCNVGNPLKMDMDGKQKNITLEFDMKGLRNGSADGTMLNFTAEVKTYSVNKGTPTIAIPLYLKSNVSVVLSGKAYNSSYYFKYNEEPTNVTFQHTYQISRFGATPISSVFLTIQIPYKLYDLEFLTIAQTPQVFVMSRNYECSVTGVSITNQRLVDITSRKEDAFRLDVNAIHTRSRFTSSQDNRTSVLKTDTNLHPMLTNHSQWENENNTQPRFYTISDLENINITYVNCSTPNITCGQVVCKIPSLETSLDVGKLELQFVVNNSRLIGNLQDNAEGKENIIHITTEAFVKVVDPKMQFIVPGAEIIVPVTTTLHHSSNVKNGVSIWIILGSILLGLLVLCLIVAALWKIGFFKRHKKDQLNSLIKGEDIPMRSDSIPQEQSNNT